jgi:hypothetical protein
MWNQFDVSEYEQRWQTESKRRQRARRKRLVLACVAVVVLGLAVGALTGCGQQGAQTTLPAPGLRALDSTGIPDKHGVVCYGIAYGGLSCVKVTTGSTRAP